MLIRIIGGHGGVSPGFRVTSYLINQDLLIDAGSVASGLSIDEQKRISNILISHPHLDHICELAYLCDNCFGLKDLPFDVYSSIRVKRMIRKHLMNDILWPDFSQLPNKKKPTIRFFGIKSEQVFKVGDYEILPVSVNHPDGALGFIVTKEDSTVLFTQDTGPTSRIWEIAKDFSSLKAIFTEVSFPNHLNKVAEVSQHHTPNTLQEEIKKMPRHVPIYIGHMKPFFQSQLCLEVKQLHCDRITLLSEDDQSFFF